MTQGSKLPVLWTFSGTSSLTPRWGEVSSCRSPKPRTRSGSVPPPFVYINEECKDCILQIQCDSFGTRLKKMRISQGLFIRFGTCIYDYIPCFMRSVSILEEMLEMFATTVQAELNAMLQSGLQDVLTNRSNFTSNVVFQFLMPTSHAPYRNWKTTFDVKLLRLVRTSCRPLSQT